MVWRNRDVPHWQLGNNERLFDDQKNGSESEGEDEEGGGYFLPQTDPLEQEDGQGQQVSVDGLTRRALEAEALG